MLGDEPAGIDESITDMVGELTNMVTGGVKLLLSKQGYEFGMATPVVVKGKEHQILHSAKGPKIIMPFSSEAGNFFLEVSFEKAS